MIQDFNNILIVSPPLTLINTPYPAGPFLTGFLKNKGYNAKQADLGIELTCKVFSRSGLSDIFDQFEKTENKHISPGSKRIFAMREKHLDVIDSVVSYLQNKDAAIVSRIASGNYLPRGHRISKYPDIDASFGTMGMSDKSRLLATVYIEELADFVADTIAPGFTFGRYEERICSNATEFNPIEKQLQKPNHLIDDWLCQLLDKHIECAKPQLIGLSVAFPGMLYGALKCGQHIKKYYSNIKVVLGGGFVSTELREIRDLRIFNFVDYLCFDDGEIPLLQLVRYINGEAKANDLVRTSYVENEKLIYQVGTDTHISQVECGNPDYSDLPLDKYFSLLEIANPMQSIWTSMRWNKLMLAHGCYWHQCSFCDVTLDYIKRYDPSPVDVLVDRIEHTIKQTGFSGFHFVDEAAPPSLLQKLSIEIIKRKLSISWWTNIRFEKSFTPDLCRLLAHSGCIAVSGGIEVANDRILKLINKGVTIEQAALACSSFRNAGIMVHAYLMYGFPTQTAQETIDSLECVRQFFEQGLLNSAFWHKFTMTCHSPIGMNPEKFNVKKVSGLNPFANNDLEHEDSEGAKHADFAEGLRAAIYNYMIGNATDIPAHNWFTFRVPHSSVQRNRVASLIKKNKELIIEDLNRQVVWLGAGIDVPEQAMHKKTPDQKIRIHGLLNDVSVRCNSEELAWFIRAKKLLESSIFDEIKLADLFSSQDLIPVEEILSSYLWRTLRENGLLCL